MDFKEVLGGEYLQIGIKECDIRDCSHYSICEHNKLVLLKQKYHYCQFGIRNDKISERMHANVFRITGKGKIRAMYRAGYDIMNWGGELQIGGKCPAEVRCLFPIDKNRIDKLRLLVAEYNYKKGLEEAWRAKK